MLCMAVVNITAKKVLGGRPAYSITSPEGTSVALCNISPTKDLTLVSKEDEMRGILRVSPIKGDAGGFSIFKETAKGIEDVFDLAIPHTQEDFMSYMRERQNLLGVLGHSRSPYLAVSLNNRGSMHKYVNTRSELPGVAVTIASGLVAAQYLLSRAGTSETGDSLIPASSTVETLRFLQYMYGMCDTACFSFIAILSLGAYLMRGEPIIPKLKYNMPDEGEFFNPTSRLVHPLALGAKKRYVASKTMNLYSLSSLVAWSAKLEEAKERNDFKGIARCMRQVTKYANLFENRQYTQDSTGLTVNFASSKERVTKKFGELVGRDITEFGDMMPSVDITTLEDSMEAVQVAPRVVAAKVLGKEKTEFAINVVLGDFVAGSKTEIRDSVLNRVEL